MFASKFINLFRLNLSSEEIINAIETNLVLNNKKTSKARSICKTIKINFGSLFYTRFRKIRAS